MAQSQDNGEGCLGCLFIVFVLLGFTHPGWWIAAFILSVIAGLSKSPSSSADRSSSSSNTSTSTSTISPTVPDDIDNLLIEISQGEIKDPVTQEIFRPGEQVHLCLFHRLAYHEDSWREMGCKCMVCGNNAHTRVYTLPAPFNINLSNPNTQAHIDWRDIE